MPTSSLFKHGQRVVNLKFRHALSNNSCSCDGFSEYQGDRESLPSLETFGLLSPWTVMKGALDPHSPYHLPVVAECTITNKTKEGASANSTGSPMSGRSFVHQSDLSLSESRRTS